MNCSKCGRDIPEGFKFCPECGTPIPQIRICPICTHEVPLNMKFCGFCGYKFEENKDTNNDDSISMGDKNVIAGDVIGKKETYNISGNATIIKNEDETKKVVTCSLCGKNLTIVNTHTCPSCGKKVCTECFNVERNMCTNCISNTTLVNERKYVEALKNALSDNKIDLSERQQLEKMQKEFNISEQRALELEKGLKDSLHSKEQFTTVEQVQIDEARDLYYDKGDITKAFDSISKVYSRHEFNEEVLNLYLPILSEIDSKKASEIINGLKVDIPVSYLVQIDINMREDLTAVEKTLDKAEKLWPENFLIKTRRAFWCYQMYNKAKDISFGGKLFDIISSLPSPSNTLENTWLEILKGKEHLLKNEVGVVYTKEYCATNNIYFYFINKEDSEATYRREYKKAIADGRIDVEEKHNLNSLQYKLGLSDDRVKAIEDEFRFKSNKEDEMSSIEEMNLKEAEVQFYGKANLDEAYEILAPIYDNNKQNERVLALYIPLLEKYDNKILAKVMNDIDKNLLISRLAEIDKLLKEDLTKAEEKLNEVEKLWADNFLIQYRRALWYEYMYFDTQKVVFISEMENYCKNFVETENKVEKSLKKQVELRCKALKNNKIETYSIEDCNKEDLYYYCVNDYVYVNNRRTGEYKKIQDAINAAKIKGTKIILGKGIFCETIHINWDVELIGHELVNNRLVTEVKLKMKYNDKFSDTLCEVSASDATIKNIHFTYEHEHNFQFGLGSVLIKKGNVNIESCSLNIKIAEGINVGSHKFVNCRIQSVKGKGNCSIIIVNSIIANSDSDCFDVRNGKVELIQCSIENKYKLGKLGSSPKVLYNEDTGTYSSASFFNNDVITKIEKKQKSNRLSVGIPSIIIGFLSLAFIIIELIAKQLPTHLFFNLTYGTVFISSIINFIYNDKSYKNELLLNFVSFGLMIMVGIHFNSFIHIQFFYSIMYYLIILALVYYFVSLLRGRFVDTAKNHLNDFIISIISLINILLLVLVIIKNGISGECSSLASFVVMCIFLGGAIVGCAFAFHYTAKLEKFSDLVILYSLVLGATMFTWMYGYNKYASYSFVYFLIPIILYTVLIIKTSVIDVDDYDAVYSLWAIPIGAALGLIVHFIVYIVLKTSSLVS